MGDDDLADEFYDWLVRHADDPLVRVLLSHSLPSLRDAVDRQAHPRGEARPGA